jgi:hypothetical protein
MESPEGEHKRDHKQRNGQFLPRNAARRDIPGGGCRCLEWFRSAAWGMRTRWRGSKVQERQGRGGDGIVESFFGTMLAVLTGVGANWSNVIRRGVSFLRMKFTVAFASRVFTAGFDTAIRHGGI